MAKINYAKIAAGANKSIRDAGGPVTLIQPSDEQVYEPGTGMTQKDPTETTCAGVVFDFSLTQAGSMFAPGTMIEAGDKHLYLSPKGVPADIGAGNRVTAFGATYAVIAINTIAPAGVPVLYEGLLRK